MGVAGINPVVYSFCASVVTTLCFKDILIVANKLFQCQCFSYAQVWSGASYHFPQLFAESLLLPLFRLLVIDGCGPHGWLSMSYNGASTHHLVLVGHVYDADKYSRTSALAIKSPSREHFWLGSRRMLVTPRGASNFAITTLSHRARITLLPIRQSLVDFVWAPGLHSITSSWPSRSRLQPGSTDAL